MSEQNFTEVQSETLSHSLDKMDLPTNTLSTPSGSSAGATAAKASFFASKPLVIGVVAAVVAGGVGIGAGVSHHRTVVAEAAAQAAIVAEMERVEAEAAAVEAARVAAEVAAAKAAAEAEAAAAAAAAAYEQSLRDAEANFPFEIQPFDVPASYVTATWENHAIKTVGELTVGNFRIVPSDDTHEFTEGYEWRIADISMKFADRNAANYGVAFNWIYNVDLYSYDLNEDINFDGDGTGTLTWYGQDYDITTTADIDFGFRGSTGYANGVWAAHVPVGYDGALIAFYNSANEVGPGSVSSDAVDADTVWFRLK